MRIGGYEGPGHIAKFSRTTVNEEGCIWRADARLAVAKPMPAYQLQSR
jgi:hypothetical protein